MDDDLAERADRFRRVADELVDALFSRPDSIDLGWHWLENLLRQLPGQLPSDLGQGPCKLVIDSIGILVRSLSIHLAPRRTQYAWIEAAAPPFRQYRAVAVLSVAASSGMAGDRDLGAIARDLLKRNIFQLTGTDELIQLPGAPLRTVPGNALSGMPDVAAWFTHTWAALRFEREQAWYLPIARRAVGANPAEIMGVWGLGILESLAIDRTRHGNRQKAWSAVEAAFREARLVERRIGRDFWCQGLAYLFRFWPPFFAAVVAPVNGAEVACADSPELTRVLAPYIGVSKDFMGIIVSLHEAEIGARLLDCAVREAGQDLLRMIRRFLETARGLQDARLWNQRWAAALKGIEAAVASQRLASGGMSARP